MSKRVAGRELDIEVHVKVMGAPECGGCSCIGRGDKPCAHDALRCSHYPPPYSGAMAYAWQVVEHMRSTRGLIVVVESPLYPWDGWWAQFRDSVHVWSSGRETLGVYHKSAPFAICLAALAACDAPVTPTAGSSGAQHVQ